ncbi:Glutamine amidotransferase class-I [Sinosporangium album]|uniref:Glutamine amidotransferase class-I n=1 Tax=Sinosporangium album TaxID=504805 RepID=A0A1G8IHP9_9ACTN|nr:gamma-glutamyl-gamma-aminobutyrate hydrolase family protein [Sinosporangium album]SDI18050.1 Glutamine amidotransferase class-I [Sinosporangium album]
MAAKQSVVRRRGGPTSVHMGGPMGALDDADHPHLGAERALLTAAVARGIPLLGVCLGAQLLAAALGGEISRGPALEIGYGDVALTGEGTADPVLGPQGPSLPVFHWHGDTFTLPAGAVRLASTDAYLNQAFRVGDRAYGFQFHVEVDAELRATLAPHLPDGVVFEPDRAKEAELAGLAVLDRFFAFFARVAGR